MKKILPVLVLTGLLVVPTVSSVQAAAPTAPTAFTSITGLENKINTIGNWFFVFLLIIAGIMLIVSGFYFITASGDETKVAKARNMLIYALIGVAVAVAAKGLVKVVESLIG